MGKTAFRQEEKVNTSSLLESREGERREDLAAFCADHIGQLFIRLETRLNLFSRPANSASHLRMQKRGTEYTGR